jgi:tetratricopeptide (TPR) repeat protein
MKHSAIISIVLFATSIQAHAQGCDYGIPTESMQQVQRSIALREQGNYQHAITGLQSLPADQMLLFCVQYEIGRNYLNIDKLDQALISLHAASSVAGIPERQHEAIFNTIGYTWLKKNNYEQAILAFERQKRDDQFKTLSVDKQTKVFNNTGYTYMKLNQYALAQENFEKALQNGSSLARENLARLDSLIKVQASGDIDTPGIFSVSLHSQRGDTGLSDKLDLFAQDLNVTPADINVFKRDTGMLSLALGANLSYVKAQQLMDQAVNAGVGTPQIVSTATWEDISLAVKK